MERQYVTFKISNQEFGVDIQNVQEITNFVECTQIPNTPKFIAGIVNIRGTITPVIDLKERFNYNNDDNDEKNKRIIIANMEEKQIGFMIDDASSVLTLNENQIDEPPEIIFQNNDNFVIGVGKIEEKLIQILDLEKILTVEEKEEVFKIMD
ncbi:MAG: purine-binding chemotaxis protein CheW [Syntrophomonadaceae bacterium]|nr:purine-binding chemotaxis protein CheW [Syntrophomonadaceae bacterium]